ncbi:DDE-domain-containing protein [Conidiobolus coronatus NRRL 28638]|uniref:DDE-domain-containing protein n=1 Tax=Conidiobolus coronatus (strain ATCC 28846 / CBS 209.66 / NRRL 28638) TaxID=796925 RepID=A0A137NPJ9_CONC2|nr:DDE-domain-containing protein [Conidiobolus coronatus NRRL 28638]|eukprot:KXN64662.1 DDE-domain-containing protein [Conidiobolus coronatus NRRL 28638]
MYKLNYNNLDINQLELNYKQNQRVYLSIEQKELIWKKYQDDPFTSYVKLAKWATAIFNINVIPRTVANKIQYPLIEKELLDFINFAQGKVILTDSLLKCKAKEIALKNQLNFKSSNGWLWRFKKRNKIKSYNLHGESGGADNESINLALPEIKEILNNYPLGNIFNFDESGLFYRQLHRSTLATEQIEGMKIDKSRYTLLFCCNWNGTEKCPLGFVGHYKTPQSFPNNQIDIKFKGPYYNNKNAWIDLDIFKHWLEWFENKMRNENRKHAHFSKCDICDYVNLEYVKVLYLPPNSTSKIQPLDKGIIKNFKDYYKNRLNNYTLNRLLNNTPDPQCITIYDSLVMANEVWENDVKLKTIVNCFNSCGIRTTSLDIINNPAYIHNNIPYKVNNTNNDSQNSNVE